MRREATIYAGRPIQASAVAKPQYNGYRRPSTDAAASRSDIYHMRRRGAKSFVDDLVLSRGVVLSRAELFCDLLRLSPMTRRFVRFRRTYLHQCWLLRSLPLSLSTRQVGDASLPRRQSRTSARRQSDTHPSARPRTNGLIRSCAGKQAAGCPTAACGRTGLPSSKTRGSDLAFFLSNFSDLR